MRRVETISAEINKLKAQVLTWQKGLAEKKAHIQSLEKEREDLIPQSFRGDNKIGGRLIEIRAHLRNAGDEVGEYEAVLKAASAELDRLMVERSQAQENAIRQELVGAYLRMEAYIEKNPEPLTVAFCRDKWLPFIRTVQNLRARIGLNGEVPDHLIVKFYQATFFPLFPRYVTKPLQNYVGKSFLQLFREHRPKFTGEPGGAVETESSAEAAVTEQAVTN